MGSSEGQEEGDAEEDLPRATTTLLSAQRTTKLADGEALEQADLEEDVLVRTRKKRRVVVCASVA